MTWLFIRFYLCVLVVLALATLFQFALMVAVFGGLFARRWRGLWWLVLPVLYWSDTTRTFSILRPAKGARDA